MQRRKAGELRLSVYPLRLFAHLHLRARWLLWYELHDKSLQSFPTFSIRVKRTANLFQSSAGLKPLAAFNFPEPAGLLVYILVTTHAVAQHANAPSTQTKSLQPRASCSSIVVASRLHTRHQYHLQYRRDLLARRRTLDLRLVNNLPTSTRYLLCAAYHSHSHHQWSAPQPVPQSLQKRK